MMENHSVLCLLIVALSVCCLTAGAAEIKQSAPSSHTDGPGLSEPQGKSPDERILWRLFHAKKYQQLSRQIGQLRQQYPKWLPPNDLSQALQDTKGAKRAIPKTTHSSRKKAINYHDPCPNLTSRWGNAENYLKINRPAKALDIYLHILVQCPTKNKMQTLEKARSRLEYGDFIQLLELGSHYLPSIYLDSLKYDALKDRLLGNEPLNLEGHERAVSGIADLLQLSKDDSLAVVIGWRYFDMKAYKKAQDWFQKAVFWNPSNENARYGQMLGLEKVGDYDQALAAYSASKRPTDQIKSVAARILKAKAWQNFDRNRLSQAAENAAQAEKISGLDQEILELNAWIAEQGGQHDKAAKLFDGLYQKSPDRKYARAYVQNQAQADRSLLSYRAEQTKGILLDEFNQFHGKELYGRKQFQSVYKLASNAFPKLENIDSPSVDVGGYVRYKSGEDGLGRLDLFKAPIATASYTVNGNHTFKLGLSRVQLYSGSPEKCVSPIGILPLSVDTLLRENPTFNQELINQGIDLNEVCQNSLFSPTQQLNEAFEVDFSYRKDGWFSPFVKLGSTPIDGVIDPAVTFDVGFVHQAGFGNWGVEAYSQPVRQSILSYTGIKDPYVGQGIGRLEGSGALGIISDFFGAPISGVSQGLEWGRVLRTGIKPSIFYRFNDAWNAFGAVDLALLEGKNVEQNNAISASVSVARNFRIPGFDYFNVGPSFNYEHFDKNLSHFTYGHGGYFSPEHYFNIGAGINFLTEEGKPYVIKGRLVAGFQDIKEARTPWFPLGNQAAGFYNPAKQSGEALDFELKGVWLITPNLQLGAGGAIRKTNGFEDYTGGLSLRYYFDNRRASFSTDIPDNMFSSMY